ncbi:hypothetical protein EPD60_09870 [Flaviaesturariibacter flavus]|uniref:Uncharacterized protein n=1 Tax=Flaviaesturariibacter flavus TaxID=2502780 RepID=A0A4R1BBI5_9BACT|nr:hypothetical protein [Flaviaesturariibacter flavus]TCJ14298.1 hypothetical protein EPD60_09870 [Flaviaesturariibacter flavus]
MPAFWKLFRFVALTWLLTNVFLPLCLICGLGGSLSGLSLKGWYALFGYSLVFSAPSLLLGWLALALLFRLRVRPISRYLLWLSVLVVLVYIMTNVWLAGFFDEAKTAWLVFSVAPVLALLLRLPAYQILLSASKP